MEWSVASVELYRPRRCTFPLRCTVFLCYNVVRMPNIFKYIALIGVVLIVSQSAFAQQNIINVPSSDVLPAGNIILKQSNKFSPFDNSYVLLENKDDEIILNKEKIIANSRKKKVF